MLVINNPKYFSEMEEKYMTEEAKAMVKNFMAYVPCDESVMHLKRQKMAIHLRRRNLKQLGCL